MTNCLTDAVAQVNCTSITAVACYCANQYAPGALSPLCRNLFSPCLPRPTGHSRPLSIRALRPIAARVCPQRKPLPSDSALSTAPPSPLRLPSDRPQDHRLPRQHRTPTRPTRMHSMQRPHRLGCPMCVDGQAWLSRHVERCLAPRCYSHFDIDRDPALTTELFLPFLATGRVISVIWTADYVKCRHIVLRTLKSVMQSL